VWPRGSFAPVGDTLKAKRDRAILATLLYHALRRDELCKLKVKDYRQERRGVPHIEVSGKGGKTRYLPLHPAASRLIAEYLEVAGHAGEETGPLFRPLHNSRDPLAGEAISTCSGPSITCGNKESNPDPTTSSTSRRSGGNTSIAFCASIRGIGFCGSWNYS
jgi:integrase